MSRFNPVEVGQCVLLLDKSSKASRMAGRRLSLKSAMMAGLAYFACSIVATNNGFSGRSSITMGNGSRLA